MDFITRYYGEQERYSKNSTTFPKKTISFVFFVSQIAGHVLPFAPG